MNQASIGKVRVRLAPSPTGPFHIGTARTALFNWLYARKNNGKFILRIEDTDETRSEEEYEIDILKSLIWLGIDWDEGVEFDFKKERILESYRGRYGPYHQSKRKDIYRKYLEQLLSQKKAYYCYCTQEELEAQRQALIAQGLPPRYTGHCRNVNSPPNRKPQLIRFVTPPGIIEFKDLIRGKIRFDASLFGDIAIAKSLDQPLYNFAVVVDDYEMKITHVIRGEDHISNTPKQLLIQKALNFFQPQYAHLPLILDKSRGKLSKRYVQSSVLSLRKRGYLKEAVLNFTALLGWHPKEDQEVLSIDDLLSKFDIKRVQKGGAVFSEEKLDWLNAQHIRRLDAKDLMERIISYYTELGKNEERVLLGSFSKDKLLQIVKIEQTRMKFLNDFLELSDFFFELPQYESRLLIWQQDSKDKTKQVLVWLYNTLSRIRKSEFKKEEIRIILDELIKEKGGGSVFWPLRVALSGKPASPDPLEIMETLGKEESLHRIQLAIEKLNNE